MDNISRYNRSDRIQSIYCYPHSNILKNLLNIREAKQLEQYEADATSIRQTGLEVLQKPTGRFTKSHLKQIHFTIFQDVYPFAGRFRQEDIWKQDTFFCKCEYIDENIESVLLRLKEESFLLPLDKEVTVKRLAYYLGELNAVHPFREGNGRAIREFIRQLALKNGYRINWGNITKDEMIGASIASIQKQYEKMEQVMEKAVL